MIKVFEHGGRYRTFPLILMNALGGLGCNAAVYFASSSFWENWHSLLLVGGVTSAALIQCMRIWQMEKLVASQIWLDDQQVTVQTPAQTFVFNAGEAVLSPDNPVPNDFKYFRKVTVGPTHFYVAFTGSVLDAELLRKAVGDISPKPLNL